MSLLVVGVFLASVYLSKHKPSVAFYWPTRVWELLLGASLALAPPGARPAREAVSLAGLVAIAISLFTFDSRTLFPGYAVLAPVLGAAAVIYGGGETRVGKALSVRPVVWIGLISYSLYLWHWPILVFTKQAELSRHLNFAKTTGCIALSFVVAALSWRFVETPFRKVSLPRMRLFFSAGALLGGALAAGFALFVLQGLPNRFSKEALSFAQANIAEKPENCINFGRFVCQVGAGKPTFLVWGDSHAGALSPAISNIAETPGLYATFNGCPPLPTYVPGELRGDDMHNCKAHNQAILERLRADKHINVVVLVAYWSGYDFTGEDLRNLLDALNTKNVVIIGDNPAPGFDVPRILALNRPVREIRPSASPESFRIIQEYPNAKLIELSEALCQDNNCPPSHALSALYYDGHHLSVYAADTIVTAFLKTRLSGIISAPSETALLPALGEDNQRTHQTIATQPIAGAGAASSLARSSNSEPLLKPITN